MKKILIGLLLLISCAVSVFAAPRYYVDPNGIVHSAGVVSSGTITGPVSASSLSSMVSATTSTGSGFYGKSNGTEGFFSSWDQDFSNNSFIPMIISSTVGTCVDNQFAVYSSGATGSKLYLCESGVWVQQVGSTPVELFDFIVSGATATINKTGAYYSLSTDTATHDALMVRKTAITKATHTIKSKFNISTLAENGTMNGGFRPLSLSTATLKPTTRTEAFTPNQALEGAVLYGGAGTDFYATPPQFYISYVDPTSGTLYWNHNSSTWTAGNKDNTFDSIALNTSYVLTLETTDTQWRLILRDSADTSIIRQSGWVNWSAIANVPSSLYLFIDNYAAVAGGTSATILYEEN